jgi:dipeptidyl aminopeptidase/acylaminoacyl peptidase
VVGALVLATVAVLNAQDAPGPKVEEQVVGPAKQGNFYSVSPRGAHLATVTQKGSRFVVVIDGVEGPKFDDVLNLDGGVKVAFSPDGTRTAYVGRSGQDYVLIVDGKEVMRPGHADDSNAVSQLAFTANSKHYWFQQHVHKSNQTGDDYMCIVFDGVAEIPGGMSPIFSSDGEHHAYVATNPRDINQRSVILDGKPVGYPGTDPKFTGDGEHLLVQTQVSLGQGRGSAVQILLDGKPWLKADAVVLYPAPVGNLVAAVVTRSTTSAPGHLTFLVIGGKKIDASDSNNIPRITFSPDGKHYAAECDTVANSRFVVVDGKRGQEYQSLSNLAFSPDSSHCAYQAMMNGKTFLVIDGEESDGYSSVQEFAFGGGGKRIGYTAVRDMNDRVVVVDGAEKKWPALQVNGIGFSPDGSRCAYWLISTAGEHLVLDGVEDAGLMVMPYRSTFDNRPQHYLFSPDGKHVAYFGTKPGELNPSSYGFVVDGKRIQTAPIFIDPMFSPDSRHVFWKVPDPQQQHVAIHVDGQRAAAFDSTSLLLGNARTWEVGDDGVLIALGQDGEKMKRLRITPSADTSVETMIAAAAAAAPSPATGKPAK